MLMAPVQLPGSFAGRQQHQRLASRALLVPRTLVAVRPCNSSQPPARLTLLRPEALAGLASDNRRALLDRGNRPSLDPMLTEKGWAPEPCKPGTVGMVHSTQEFEELQDKYKNRLVVLMCKASHCRPCKMFGRKYSRMAERFSDSVLCEIMGDESNDTKKMMIGMEVRVTPTFRLYRDHRLVEVVTGTHESKLSRIIRGHLDAYEAGGNYCNLDERVEDAPVADE